MIDWDAVVLGPVMAIFGEDPAHGLPIYRPAEGAPFTLTDAVFDDAFHALVMGSDGAELGTVQPVLGVRLSLFPTPPERGDEVDVPRAGMSFVVQEVQPDGHGHAKLLLSRSS